MSLINFEKQNLYRSKLDENVCKRAYDFVQINKSSYTEQTWGCRIKTSVNNTYNILNCKELHDLKLNILSHIHNFMYLRNYFFLYHKFFYHWELLYMHHLFSIREVFSNQRFFFPKQYFLFLLMDSFFLKYVKFFLHLRL